MRPTKPLDTRSEQERVSYNVKKYFKENKLAGKAVALKLGISPSFLSKLCSGKKFFPEEIAEKMSQLFGFDKYYLTHGSIEIIAIGGEDDEGRAATDTILEHELMLSNSTSEKPDYSGDKLLDTISMAYEVIRDCVSKMNDLETKIRIERQRLTPVYEKLKDIQIYLNNESIRKDNDA